MTYGKGEEEKIMESTPRKKYRLPKHLAVKADLARLELEAMGFRFDDEKLDEHEGDWWQQRLRKIVEYHAKWMAGNGSVDTEPGVEDALEAGITAFVSMVVGDKRTIMKKFLASARGQSPRNPDGRAWRTAVTNARTLDKDALLWPDGWAGVCAMKPVATRYFAYGSNMNLAHLRNCVGRWGAEPRGIRQVRPATLVGYRLRTNYLRISGWGAANIEPAEDAAVEGVIMTISPEVHQALRAKEGAPHRYVETSVLVLPRNASRRVRAMTYLVSDEHCLPIDLPVTTTYRQLILDGAKDAKLSPRYQACLRRVLVTPGHWRASRPRKQSA
jgi:hypothetical protein